MVTLATERLLLRPWQESDRDQYCDLSADPAVMAYIGDGRPRDRAYASARFDDLSAGWEQHGFGLFALERIADAEFLGFCGLAVPDFLPEILPAVEIGWRLPQAGWGQGYGREAATAVADWAFDELGLDRLVAVIQVNNDRSKRLADWLGMTLHRRTVVPGHGAWADVYQLTSSTWRRARTTAGNHRELDDPVRSTSDQG